jgi:antitoxin MazE
MRVEKWGDDLAIRLPGAIAEALGLKKGDEIELRMPARELWRSRAWSHPSSSKRRSCILRESRWRLPPEKSSTATTPTRARFRLE